MSMRNSHLSFSRLSRLETCPLSYFLHYVEKRSAEPGVPLRFGKAMHATLECLEKEHIADERVAPFSWKRAVELFRDAWNAEGLSGIDLFNEGLRILRLFISDSGSVDHRSILGVETEFHVPVGPFDVLGFIDRIDHVDDETVEIIDFKTNFQLFTREYVDSSLQLSLYEIAIRRLLPWVKNVKLTFWMLRHGLRVHTARTPQQLDDALKYIETLGLQAEHAQDFPPRLNPNCVYCDHKKDCPAYAQALEGRRDFIAEDLADLDAVAREREDVAQKAKILYARKEELDNVLKAQLEQKNELLAGGMRYAMTRNATLEYPLEPTLTVLAKATGRSRDDLHEKLAAVDKKQLDSVLKSAARKMDRPHLAMVKAELEAHARKSYTPRLWAKEIT
ncbi:PD-(D/E)XK nuclease family protein [Pendulispora brunnea]|uniref:PD-(D/E)XK nuclease family protein n=1 Tax=Pendulispora brunnea TaxID=2905690 RepID=A0ABZ2KBT5_9BACT